MSAGEIKDSVSLLPCFYFVELPILVSSMVSLYFLEWTDVFKPVKFGFTCHDRSLNLPYVDPNHEVVPLLMLFSLVFAGPAIMIMIGEAVLFCCQSCKKCSVRAEVNINAAGCNFNSFIRRALRFIGVHVFGLCATALITDILQLMTGLPTPYFLTVCKPNYTTLNITCEQNPYVLEDICDGDDPAAISQGRKSFPSQHATLASFAAVYISMYFNSTLTDSSKLLKPLLVFFFTICALICGLTRIIQYKNHAIDVYLGFLLGGGIAVYLGLYAVGNFQPSEEVSHKPPPILHTIPCSLPHISKEAMFHLMQIKANMAGEHGIPASEGQLLRGFQKQRTDVHNNHSGADVDGITLFSPATKDATLTFSHTLPRVHTSQAMAAYEENARRHAATLHHHSSKDSSHSRQLLSQWKSKNNKCPMQVTDSFSSSVDSSSGQHLHHHGSMEFRSSSEPSAIAPNGGFEGHAFISNMATGCSTTLPSNCSSIIGGARMSMQSRPGSSQLVHIPEESQDNTHTGSLRSVSRGENEEANSIVQVNWKRARNTTACGTGEKGSRVMQVKQQGLLQAQSKSLDESSLGCSNTAICKSSHPNRTLNDQEPPSTTEPMSSGSTTGSISGAIVRVKAHPEMEQLSIQPTSTDCGGSWRWQSLDSSTETTGGEVSGQTDGTGSLKRSLQFNNLNRDLESSDLMCQGSANTKRANNVVSPTPIFSNPPTITVYTENRGQSDHGFQTQHLSTIRVSTGDGSSSGNGGGGSEGAGGSLSETLSIGSSHESSLRRKGNIILIPERAKSPDNARNIFYKGTSMTPVFKD